MTFGDIFAIMVLGGLGFAVVSVVLALLLAGMTAVRDRQKPRKGE